jgi:hypothetical protein
LVRLIRSNRSTKQLLDHKLSKTLGSLSLHKISWLNLTP